MPVEMKGRHIPEPPHQWATGERLIQPGDYWKDADGHWHGVTPNDMLANLSAHKIIEHEDGTITVDPSIECSGGVGEYWHGHLKRGVWVEC